MDASNKIKNDTDTPHSSASPYGDHELEKSLKEHYQKLSPSDYRREWIDSHNNCCICGSELEFAHVTHFTHLEVQEEAFCPSCRIRTRNEAHRLQ